MFSSGSADTRGAVGVGGCSHGGVDIGWGPTHVVLVSRGGHAELHKHVLPGSRYFLGSKFSESQQNVGTKDGLIVKKREKIRDASGYVCFTAHIVIHIHPYTGYPIRPLEPPGYR